MDVVGSMVKCVWEMPSYTKSTDFFGEVFLGAFNTIMQQCDSSKFLWNLCVQAEYLG